jgi:PKHD-type hydroxylase
MSAKGESCFAAWEGAFTSEELDRIVAHGDGLALRKADLFGAEEKTGTSEAEQIRITRTAWINPGAETGWIFDRMQRVAMALNSNAWQFDLTGFSEAFQYTVYHGTEGGHYGWHVDQGTLPPRKLSLSLQLSEADAYEGCDLEFLPGHASETAPRGRGTVIAFPSYLLHRVTPIRSGTRKSLVVWVTGPKLR